MKLKPIILQQLERFLHIAHVTTLTFTDWGIERKYAFLANLRSRHRLSGIASYCCVRADSECCGRNRCSRTGCGDVVRLDSCPLISPSVLSMRRFGTEFHLRWIAHFPDATPTQSCLACVYVCTRATSRHRLVLRHQKLVLLFIVCLRVVSLGTSVVNKIDI